MRWSSCFRMHAEYGIRYFAAGEKREDSHVPLGPCVLALAVMIISIALPARALGE